MKTTLLHVFALAAAACLVFLTITGAAVTNSLAQPGGGDSLSLLFTATGHQHLGEGVGLLVVLLALWTVIAAKPARPFAWGALALVIAEIGLGHGASKTAPMVGLIHAFLSPVLLAIVAAIALATSPSWRRDPVMLQDKGWPPMRGLARTTLVFVVLQVLLGASFRHGALGVMPHIVGALVVVILLLTLVICLTQMPGESFLKSAAITLLVAAAVQIFLGLTVVSMSERALAHTAGLVFSASHVALGAITLSLSLVVAMEARRSVRPQA